MFSLNFDKEKVKPRKCKKWKSEGIVKLCYTDELNPEFEIASGSTIDTMIWWALPSIQILRFVQESNRILILSYNVSSR